MDDSIPLAALPDLQDEERRAALLRADSPETLMSLLKVRGGSRGLVKVLKDLPLAFFGKDGLLVHIVKLAYALPKLLQKVPLLGARTDAVVILSQLQIGEEGERREREKERFFFSFLFFL
jgi:hypothetical protein